MLKKKKENEIGTIEAGKFADIIATNGNPLEDISELTRIKFVMKGGLIINGKINQDVHFVQAIPPSQPALVKLNTVAVPVLF